jgi:hypothetical protein
LELLPDPPLALFYLDIARNLDNDSTEYSIESLHKKLGKATKNEQAFEKPDRLLDYLFMIGKEFEVQNWMKYPFAHFNVWTQFTQSI